LLSSSLARRLRKEFFLLLNTSLKARRSQKGERVGGDVASLLLICDESRRRENFYALRSAEDDFIPGRIVPEREVSHSPRALTQVTRPKRAGGTTAARRPFTSLACASEGREGEREGNELRRAGP